MSPRQNGTHQSSQLIFFGEVKEREDLLGVPLRQARA